MNMNTQVGARCCRRHLPPSPLSLPPAAVTFPPAATSRNRRGWRGKRGGREKEDETRERENWFDKNEGERVRGWIRTFYGFERAP